MKNILTSMVALLLVFTSSVSNASHLTNRVFLLTPETKVITGSFDQRTENVQALELFLFPGLTISKISFTILDFERLDPGPPSVESSNVDFHIDGQRASFLSFTPQQLPPTNSVFMPFFPFTMQLLDPNSTQNRFQQFGDPPDTIAAISNRRTISLDTGTTNSSELVRYSYQWTIEVQENSSPLIAATPLEADFGDVEVSQATPTAKTFETKNIGLVNLAFADVTIEGTNSDDFGIASKTCTGPAGPTLAPQATCTVDVVFAPKSLGANVISTGPKEAQLVITSNAVNRPILKLDLKGHAIETLVASFTSSPNPPLVSEAVSFDASASSGDGMIVSYDWDFGDGGTGTGVMVDQTYGAPGPYSVKLTVTDDSGQTATHTQDVEVSCRSSDPLFFQKSTTRLVDHQTRIFAFFVPLNGCTLHEVASAYGYDHFNWVNYVTELPDPFVILASLDPPRLNVLEPEILDPPLGSGVIHGTALGSGFEFSSDKLPYYWDEGSEFIGDDHLNNWMRSDKNDPQMRITELWFFDNPSWPTNTGMSLSMLK